MQAVAASAIACFAALALTLLAGSASAAANITGPLLQAAAPRVISLPASPSTAPIPLDGSTASWRGEPSHIAGTAHYDRGEWIYEDYPWSAYGAALPGVSPLLGGLSALGQADPSTARLQSAVAEVQQPTGAGPFVEEADLFELRFAVRGPDLLVLARTTTMRSPVRTALLLLFDTGRSGVLRSVPFGSGLQTSAADTAVLVTAAGTRIVDLVSGRSTIAPAVADPTGYVNSLETRLPLGLVARPGDTAVRFVGATGLAVPGTYGLASSGPAGPLAKVVPRFEMPVEAVEDREQAEALAAHNIDQFFTTVSLDRLRRGDSERLMPGVGYSDVTFVAPASVSSEDGTNGTLQQYGLYIPKGFSGGPTPATLVLHGSSFQTNGEAVVTPGLYRQLGDTNGAILVSPSGRSGFSLFEGVGYLNVQEALADAEARLPIDPNRLTVAGYSMGGFGTYMFAATEPDRFAAAFVIEGGVGGGQPSTTPHIFTPDVVPSLANLVYTPIEIYQGDLDADVPVTNGLAAADRLRSLGFRYRLNVFPGHTHFTVGILDDYTIGQRLLHGARRVSNPAEVRFSRVMPYEHAIDTGVGSDTPTPDHPIALHFDHAWFVHDLRASDPVNGTASIDVRTLARPSGSVRTVDSTGVDQSPDGELPSAFDEQHWLVGPVTRAPRNALDAQLTGASHVALDLASMGLTAGRPMAASVRTDARTTVVLELPRRTWLTVFVDGAARTRPTRSRAVQVALAPGQHEIKLRPYRRSHHRHGRHRRARHPRVRGDRS